MPKITKTAKDDKAKSIQICMQCGNSLITKYADSLNGQPYCRSCYKVKVATARKRKAISLAYKALDLLPPIQPSDLEETFKQVDFPYDEALTTLFVFQDMVVIEIRKDNKSYRYQLSVDKMLPTDNVLILNDLNMQRGELEYQAEHTEIPLSLDPKK